MIELEFLKEQNVSESLIHGIEEFRKNYNVDETQRHSGTDCDPQT